MADWPVVKGGYFSQSNSVNPTALTANTKGAWTTVATLMNNCGLIECAIYYSALSGGYLFDIGIGTDENKVVIVENIHTGWPNNQARGQNETISIPIFIAKGQTVYVRYQQNGGSTNVWVNFSFYESFFGLPSFAGVDTYGANTVSTRGTPVDPGGTANVWGSYVELSSSLPRNYRGFILGIPYDYNGGRTDEYYWNLKLAIGAAGSEQQLCYGFRLHTRDEHDGMNPKIFPFIEMHLPKGQRLSISARCNYTDATDRKTDVILYTVY